ncbi:PqqD family protein [Deinococcus sonorensis]|uniref:PqqD family protein n=2 Tax=Deinococcus sonorensis TaxID=309891 RepID=A0AAU7UAP3_9DEIO
MWTADPDVLITDLQDELVLMHARSAQMYRLNDVARTIWQHLPASQETLLQALLTQYEVSPEQAGADLDRLLNELSRLEMVRRT